MFMVPMKLVLIVLMGLYLQDGSMYTWVLQTVSQQQEGPHTQPRRVTDS